MDSLPFSLRDVPLNMTASPFDSDKGSGVSAEKSKDLELKVIAHRNEFYWLIIARYREIIVNIRQYKNLPASINKYKLENLLRQNQQPVIGRGANGLDMILGVINSNYTTSDPMAVFNMLPLTKNAIQWLVPDYLIPSHDIREITQLDDATSGDFVILRNKPITHVNDFQLIDFYAKELAEIVASRYSLIIQSKVSTVLQSDINDETINQAIEKLYNGAPFMKVSELFNPDNVLTLGNESVGALLKQNDEQYNNTLKQLNNHLAIDSAGVNKLSGVSDDEVASNNDFITANANMYINGIEEPFLLYNKRMGTDYHVYFENQTVSDTTDLTNDVAKDKGVDL